jgi:hypothetical protein
MWSKHLFKKIESESQIKNSRCFFMNKYDIECSCIDNNSFARLVSSTNVNLIMISTFIIINWVDHIARYLRDEILLESWNLRQIYVRDKLNHFASRLRIENRDLLKRIDENFKSLKCHENASTIVIITIKECYYQHVDQLFIRKTIFKRIFRSRFTIIEVSMNFAWDRACIDETHTEQKFNNEAILIFKKIDFHVRKWFDRNFFRKLFRTNDSLNTDFAAWLNSEFDIVDELMIASQTISIATEALHIW